MRDRQWRRAQRERVIARVRAWTSRDNYGWSGTPEELEIHVRRRAVNPQSCSSYCCGNPRKWFGASTLQEYSWFDRVREDLEDVGVKRPLPRRDW
jgi:hypothetical protein